jgi:hypothetical protein
MPAAEVAGDRTIAVATHDQRFVIAPICRALRLPRQPPTACKKPNRYTIGHIPLVEAEAHYRRPLSRQTMTA